jgi:hypothetical protein
MQLATAGQRHQAPKPLTTGQITVLMRKRKQGSGDGPGASRGLGAWFTEIGFRSEQMSVLMEISGIYLIDTVEDLVYLHANVSAGVRKVFAYPGLFDKIEAALTQEAEDNAGAGGAISGGLRPEGVCKPAALAIAGTRGKSVSESESKRGRSGVRGAQAAYAARAEITSGSVTAAAAGAGAAEGGALSGAGTGAAAAAATAAAAAAAVAAAAAGDQCGPPSPTRRAW